MPPNFSSMPPTSACNPVCASTAPLLTISMAFGTDTPILSANICHAGIPASVNCSISSLCTFALAAIWPNASVTRSTPSLPRPTPAAASPTAVNVGMTCSAVNPKAKNFCVAAATSLNSNGVFAAKFCKSLSRLCALSALPSIFVIAACVC